MSYFRFLVIAATVAAITPSLSVPSWALRAPCPPDHTDGRGPNVYTDKGESLWIYPNRLLADLKRVDGICVRMEGAISEGGVVTWTSTKGEVILRQEKGGVVTTIEGRTKK